MITNKSKEISIENLEKIKDSALEIHNIIDEYEIADIELVFMELYEYIEYINFISKKSSTLSTEELEDFLNFYSSKVGISSIVKPKDAERIINLLFDTNIDII